MAPARTPSASGRAYGGLPAAERVAARRARFVDAGLEVFGTVGLRGATVRGLCAAAGLTDRYFYESFANVEALLAAVHASLVERLREALLRESVDSPAWAGDAAAVAAQAARGYGVWFDFVRDPRVGRVLLLEVLGVSPDMDARYEAAMEELSELTISPVDVAMPGRALQGEPRAIVGRALAGAALHVAKRWMASGYAASREDVVRACTLIASGTLAALKDAG